MKHEVGSDFQCKSGDLIAGYFRGRATTGDSIGGLTNEHAAWQQNDG
jgi:hypothetical protein